jgi:hypothetical protein
MRRREEEGREGRRRRKKKRKREERRRKQKKRTTKIGVSRCQTHHVYEENKKRSNTWFSHLLNNL